MKFWLWVFLVTSDGTTAFDVEFDSYDACVSSIAVTEKEQLKKNPEVLILGCRDYSMNAQPPAPKKQPTIRT